LAKLLSPKLIPQHKNHKTAQTHPSQKSQPCQTREAARLPRAIAARPCHSSTTVPQSSFRHPIPVAQHGQTVPTSTTVPTPPRPKTPILHSKAIMSTSLTPEQAAEQALKEKAKLEAQLKYVQRQLGQLMEEKRRSLWSSRSSSKHWDSDDSKGSNPISDSSEEEHERRPR